jgi:hypothetical protein
MPLSASARERLVGGDVEVREEHEPFAQPRVLGLDRLLDLEQQVGLAQAVVHRDDARTGSLVLLRRGTRFPLPPSSRREPRDPRWISSRRAGRVSATRYSSVLISFGNADTQGRRHYLAGAARRSHEALGGDSRSTITVSARSAGSVAGEGGGRDSPPWVGRAESLASPQSYGVLRL